MQSYSQGTLILSGENGNLAFEVDSNTIYGVSKQSGIADLLMNEEHTAFADNAIGKVYCKCNENTMPPTQCTSGGEGSTRCSVAQSGFDSKQKCETGCSKGYYACCWMD